MNSRINIKIFNLRASVSLSCPFLLLSLPGIVVTCQNHKFDPRQWGADSSVCMMLANKATGCGFEITAE